MKRDPDWGFASRAEYLRQVGTEPPPPPTYPIDTVQNLRDAVTVQSERALEMVRAAGLKVPE